MVTLKLHLYGVENLTRTCPVITYHIEVQQMKYVTVGCGEGGCGGVIQYRICYVYGGDERWGG